MAHEITDLAPKVSDPNTRRKEVSIGNEVRKREGDASLAMLPPLPEQLVSSVEGVEHEGHGPVHHKRRRSKLETDEILLTMTKRSPPFPRER